MLTALGRCIPTLAVAAPAACASGGASASANGESPAPQHHDRTAISRDELLATQASNLFEAVQRLHPEWLAVRTSASVARTMGKTAGTDTDVQVYVDNQRGGNTDLLKSLAVTGASSLHYFSASEAQARFGNGNLNGVIQIISATGSTP